MQRNRKFMAYSLALAITIMILIGIYFGKAYVEKGQDIPSEENIGHNEPSKGTSEITNLATQNPPSIKDNSPSIITASEKDYQRLEDILPQNEIIQKLPENAKIKLSFYNFNTGERQWERTYILTKGDAVQGDASLSDVDIALIMHSRNLPLLKGDNFCEVINAAQRNRDFAMETERSTVSLAWQYKSVIGYRDCLGF
jgi:hypothetical protein